MSLRHSLNLSPNLNLAPLLDLLGVKEKVRAVIKAKVKAKVRAKYPENNGHKGKPSKSKGKGRSGKGKGRGDSSSKGAGKDWHAPFRQVPVVKKREVPPGEGGSRRQVKKLTRMMSWCAGKKLASRQRRITAWFWHQTVGMSLMEFSLLLKCGSDVPSVYHYDPKARAAFCFARGQLAWPLEYLLSIILPSMFLLESGALH